MKPERIPIFPLETVLFPGTPLPLHIFEERYKLMISRCREQSLDFGVVLARELQGEGVRVLMGPRAAFAFGAGLGAGVGVAVACLRALRRRR